MHSPSYRISTPEVAHETLDGESVIVNLESGFYYSLRNVAAVIWLWLEQSCGTTQMITTLAEHYQLTEDTIVTDFSPFIRKLTQEKLITEIAESSGAMPDTSLLPPTYLRPVLEKFGDMQQLLLLDPIHEVAEEGWPHLPAN
ncbi:MAG TPA: PqqD family protein [Anaerolineales bacterium]|nr:PqqD family protein [Anaerolineales bacterium]